MIICPECRYPSTHTYVIGQTGSRLQTWRSLAVLNLYDGSFRILDEHYMRNLSVFTCYLLYLPCCAIDLDPAPWGVEVIPGRERMSVIATDAWTKTTGQR